MTWDLPRKPSLTSTSRVREAPARFGRCFSPAWPQREMPSSGRKTSVLTWPIQGRVFLTRRQILGLRQTLCLFVTMNEPGREARFFPSFPCSLWTFRASTRMLCNALPVAPGHRFAEGKTDRKTSCHCLCDPDGERATLGAGHCLVVLPTMDPAVFHLVAQDVKQGARATSGPPSPLPTSPSEKGAIPTACATLSFRCLDGFSDDFLTTTPFWKFGLLTTGTHVDLVQNSLGVVSPHTPLSLFSSLLRGKGGGFCFAFTEVLAPLEKCFILRTILGVILWGKEQFLFCFVLVFGVGQDKSEHCAPRKPVDTWSPCVRGTVGNIHLQTVHLWGLADADYSTSDG